MRNKFPRKVYDLNNKKEVIVVEYRYDFDCNYNVIDEHLLTEEGHKLYLNSYKELDTKLIDKVCIFWNNNGKSFRVARLKQIAWGNGRIGKYKDYQGNYYDNCELYTLGYMPSGIKI